jgi:hypothetical protein
LKGRDKRLWDDQTTGIPLIGFFIFLSGKNAGSQPMKILLYPVVFPEIHLRRQILPPQWNKKRSGGIV